MWMNVALEKSRWLVISLIVGMAGLGAVPAIAGAYLDSAHGNTIYGVDRSTIDGKYADYATGNCGHCHEMHASIEGGEPWPGGGPDSHTLFAPYYNLIRTENPYLETDNFCFYCHSSVAGPQVANQDYSGTFGGANSGGGPQSIIEAFNQLSYHNLYDIRVFLNNTPAFSTWFAKRDNPCSACHNSHLAKRNWDNGQTGFPLLSTISKPGFSNYLWGEAEVMTTYFGYEAPFAFIDSREPSGIGEQDGGNTPDYVDFCLSCHNPDNTIWSTSLNRELKKIDWGNLGVLADKHGDLPRDGFNQLREPYAASAAIKTDFVLSCLDCHESHGSENVMMLRRRINGEDLEGVIASTDTMSYACKRCHMDDLAAAEGTNEANRWEYAHHGVTGAPYAKAVCENCHVTSAGDTPIYCGNCHGHGKNDSSLGASASGRKTF
jgi:hypothetical protein